MSGAVRSSSTTSRGRESRFAVAKLSQDQAASLEHEWNSMQPEFDPFHAARNLDGTWKSITHGTLPPDIHPDLKKYAQGLQYMTGMLEEDFRILNILHTANPTMIDAAVRGSSQAARNLERDFKLTWASWWDNDINVDRWLDSWVYEGQNELGLTVPWLRWRKQDNEDGTSGCPVYVEETIVDALRWKGNFRNPSVLWCKYKTSVIDCGIKNADGARPAYQGDGSLGWTSEMLPEFYSDNSGKEVEIIVRDAVDPLAMCPLAGCHHNQRRITVYICKAGGSVADYEEVESYDSPFEQCSFIIVGGNVKKSERNPHRILRPSAWILIDLVLKYNFLFNSLLASFAREMADERMYTDASRASPEVLAALAGDEDMGQAGTIEKPDVDSNSIMRLPGSVSMLPKPSTQELMALLDKTERQYELYRPNRNLTGNAAVSEVTGTAAVLQKQGAGLMLAQNLTNWDGGHKRMFYETMHGIRFTSHFEPDDEQTRYVATVSGRENVRGSRGGTSAGDEVYLDAKKCESPVTFTAETSADTPADRRDREERARTAKASGIFVQRDVDEAYGIFDPDMQEELRFREQVRNFLLPMKMRRVAARVVSTSAAKTGVDMGEEPMVNQLPVPDMQQPQTYNTMDANAARRNAPVVEPPATGNIGAGGSSGLG